MDELAERVLEAVSRSLIGHDPEVRVVAARRPDGKLDVTVVSRLFDSLSAEDRERIVWDILRAFSRQDTVQMTYSLLITPSEAAALFAGSLGPDGTQDTRKDSA